MLHDRTQLAAAERQALEAELARLRLLEDVVRWGFAQQPPRTVEDVVVQDEFTHDVVMPWRDGSYLVFDTT